MPTYEFCCENGDVFDLVYSMADVPQHTDCIHCDLPALRRPSAPHLSATGSAAYRLIDSTEASAESPAVVTSSIPGNRSGPSQRVTSHPLHRQLPRP